MPSPADNYPKDIPLRDGLSVSVRPLASGDEDALLNFFRGIPENELFFLKDDVTSPDIIRGWVRDTQRPDPEPAPGTRTSGRSFALLALHDGRIVGEAALVRRRGKARSHLADLRVMVAEDARHHGLGTALISELCDVARDTGLNGVLFEAVEEAQDEALAAADALGFTRLGRIYGGAIDPEGRLHDVVLLAMPMRRWRTASYF
jgi:GNAT superfamily N-acetyltransferase